MHELSIAEALVDAVQQELRAYPGAQVRGIRVRVGALRLVVAEALQACFAAATRQTPLAGAQLDLEPVAAEAECPECRERFAVEERWFECPRCHSLNGRLLAGDELVLAGLEVESSGEADGGQ
ncbi:hydrogenase maturation nickel metallochaperone HypA [bacterium]|nr:hydrogenase maturation nickel metallochaperone HypA [bacterium]